MTMLQLLVLGPEALQHCLGLAQLVLPHPIALHSGRHPLQLGYNIRVLCMSTSGARQINFCNSASQMLTATAVFRHSLCV